MNSNPAATPAIPGRQPLGTADLEIRKLTDYAFKLVRKHFRTDDDEYFSEANLAVLQAVRGFKPNGTASLKSYVRWMVLKECGRLEQQNRLRGQTFEPIRDRDFPEPRRVVYLDEMLDGCSDPDLARELSAGRTHQEIADARGIPRQTLTDHVAKLRKELAPALCSA